MKIYCLGDSLTEGDYGVFGKSGIANVKEKNYPYFLSECLGAVTVNKGRCGINPSGYLDYYLNGNVNVSDADIIVIMLGTNGGLDPDTDTKGNSDFSALIDLCLKDAPKSKMVLCTPPHATENPAMSNFGYAPRVKKAVTFVKKIAAKKHINIIDVAEYDAFSTENESVMQPNDGLHLSEIGYKTLATFIGDNLKKMYPDLF